MSEERDKSIIKPPSIDEKFSTIEGNVYAGNPYTTFRTVMLIILVIASIIIVAANNEFTIGQSYPVILCLIPFSIIFGLQMQYFIIENGRLVIKNHYFPWMKKIINLKDIQEVGLESPGRRPTSLRVYISNSEAKLYSAGSLRKCHWKKLLTDLKSIGITIKPSMYTKEYDI